MFQIVVTSWRIWRWRLLAQIQARGLMFYLEHLTARTEGPKVLIDQGKVVSRLGLAYIVSSLFLIFSARFKNTPPPKQGTKGQVFKVQIFWVLLTVQRFFLIFIHKFMTRLVALRLMVMFQIVVTSWRIWRWRLLAQIQARGLMFYFWPDWSEQFEDRYITLASIPWQ